MKKMTLNALLAGTLLLGFSACNNGGTSNEDSVDTAEKMNEAMTDNKATPLTEDDTKFAVMAADAGMTEVELGKLALTKTKNEDVKKFAQMMVDDHTAANNKLMSLASAKQIALPATVSDEHKKHIDDMGKMSGADFDKHYIDMMVDDHGTVVDAFKKENENTADAELKAFTAETLPTLEKHHNDAKAIKDKMK